GRTSSPGWRRIADHARAGPQHDLPDEKHRAGQRKIWIACQRTACVHTFHPVKEIICWNFATTRSCSSKDMISMKNRSARTFSLISKETACLWSEMRN